MIRSKFGMWTLQIAAVKEELQDPMWLSNLIKEHFWIIRIVFQLTLVPDTTKSTKEAARMKKHVWLKLARALTEEQKAEINAKLKR